MAIKDLRDNLKRLKDSDPIELAGQLNNWLQESGEALRLRIEDEVEKAVTKRGFVKKSEFLKLEARISQLEGKKSAAKTVKKKTEKVSKKSTTKATSSVKKQAKGKK